MNTRDALDAAEQCLGLHQGKLRSESEQIRADYQRRRREREDAVANAAASHVAACRSECEAILAPVRARKLNETDRARLEIFDAELAALASGR